MSHIKRYLLAAAIAVTSPVLGGSAFANEPEQIVEDSQSVEIAYVPPRIDPSTLHGEIPNTHPTQKCITLGAGEHFALHFATFVRQIDSRLNDEEIERIVDHLSQSLEGQGTGVSSRELSPGVSACVMYASAATRIASDVASWSLYLGKYSGILQDDE